MCFVVAILICAALFIAMRSPDPPVFRTSTRTPNARADTVTNVKVPIPSLTANKPRTGSLELNNMAGRQALVVPALKRHTATVIMAHGLGDRWAEVPIPSMNVG